MKLIDDRLTGSADDLASMLGISARRVQQLDNEGKVKSLAHGVYDIPAGVLGYCEFIRGTTRGSTSTAEEKQERIRLTRVKADTAELKHFELVGDLLRRQVVNDQDFKLARTLRSNLESIPDRIGAIVAAENSVDAVHHILTTEIARALNEIIEAMNAQNVDSADLDIVRREARASLGADAEP